MSNEHPRESRITERAQRARRTRARLLRSSLHTRSETDREGEVEILDVREQRPRLFAKSGGFPRAN